MSKNNLKTKNPVSFEVGSFHLRKELSMYKKHYPTLRNLSSSAAHKSCSKDDSNMSSNFFMSSIFNYGTNICNKYEIAKCFSKNL